MSKAKDDYYELKGYLDSYMGGPVNDVSNYVTELENKAKMFDEMVGALNELTSIIKIHSEATKNTFAWAEVDHAKVILERTKKLQEAEEC